MGIFYNPPLPPVGNSAATPPLPHDPIPAQGDQPPRYSAAIMLVAVLASWPLDLEPRLTRPNDQQQRIAPLTLAYGTQPTPSAFLSPTKLHQIVATWPETWGAQTAPKSAAWSVPPVLTVVPYRPLSKDIVAAWEPPWVSPPRPVSIATLTLPTGDQPTPSAFLAPIKLLHIVASWQVTWETQSAAKNAGWNVPPILSAVVYAPLPRLIWSTWEPPWIQPPTPVAIATLTLPTGAQPTPQSSLSATKLTAIASAWAQTWDVQTASKGAAWNVPTAQVPYTPLPKFIWVAWSQPSVPLPSLNGSVAWQPNTIAPTASPRKVSFTSYTSDTSFRTFVGPSTFLTRDS